MAAGVNIALFDSAAHQAAVVHLWKDTFGYETAHNEPNLVIAKKVALHDGLFFVALQDHLVVGTVMGGYDGHRGWIYSLAVDPDHQRRGLGSHLVRHLEARLAELGCLKINLQILASHASVEAFYRSLGYLTEERISMGKRLPLKSLQS